MHLIWTTRHFWVHVMFTKRFKIKLKKTFQNNANKTKVHSLFINHNSIQNTSRNLKNQTWKYILLSDIRNAHLQQLQTTTISSCRLLSQIFQFANLSKKNLKYEILEKIRTQTNNRECSYYWLAWFFLKNLTNSQVCKPTHSKFCKTFHFFKNTKQFQLYNIQNRANVHRLHDLQFKNYCTTLWKKCSQRIRKVQ